MTERSPRGEALHALRTRNEITWSGRESGAAACGCTFEGNTFTISDACRAEISATWARAMDYGRKVGRVFGIEHTEQEWKRVATRRRDIRRREAAYRYEINNVDHLRERE